MLLTPRRITPNVWWETCFLTYLSERLSLCVYFFYLAAILYFNKEILIWHSAPDMVLNAYK